MCSNEYREELDRVRLSEDSRRALVKRLADHRRTEAPRPSRQNRLLQRGLVIAAVIALLAVAAAAAVAAAPTLRDTMFGDGPGYEQSSALIGKEVEQNGWTVTITDCVGDDRYLYLGVEVIAPEGTALDQGEYNFDKDRSEVDMAGADGWDWQQLPDQDPTDNRVAFIVRLTSVYSGPLNGQRMHLVLRDFYHYGEWNREDRAYEHVSDCSSTWDFGWLTISYPDSTIRLEPNVPVTTLGVEAAITQVEVSPLGVRVRIEGDALKGHHSWVPKDAPDGWYSCIDYQDIILYDEDGNALVVDGNITGSGCGGGKNPDEDGYLILCRTYDKSYFNAPHTLVDVDSLASIFVCGVEIPLK